MDIEKMVRVVGEQRTILEKDGAPILIGVATRPATSAPEGSRVKAAFVAKIDDERGMVLPVAQNTIGIGFGFSTEIRLEQN